MNWDISYLIQSNVIVLCALICIPAFLSINKSIPKEIKKYVYILLLILLIEATESYTDHVLGSLTDDSHEILRIAVSVVGYIARPMLLYVVTLIMTRESQIKHRKLLLLIPACFTIVIAPMAFFTKMVFYYDENNVFHGGPLRNVMFVVLICYFVIILAISIVKRKKKQDESYIMFGIVALLIFDVVSGLSGLQINVHQQIEAIAIILYFMYFVSVFNYERQKAMQLSHLESEAQLTKNMLDQSIETLAFTIDAKDRYTRGHSFRVAKYARQIAKLDGKDEEYCRLIYLTGLLHDIGKISINDEIINKTGKLTSEEYEVIKTHPVIGAKILEKMKDYSFLKDGAESHHERYDGKGYPNGLSGTQIPEIARIIAVSDAYDAMTSYRSYREMMDQADVKQEIWKGAGTQFDPFYAKLMISLIDSDIDYEMREFPGTEDDAFEVLQSEDIVWKARTPQEIKSTDQVMNETSIFLLGEFASVVNNWLTPSRAVEITEQPIGMRFVSKTNEDANYLWYVPTAIVFSSENGTVEDDDYDELGVFVSTGYSWRAGSALTDFSEINKLPEFTSWDDWIEKNKLGMEYTYTAHRKDNIIYLTIENSLLKIESKLTLPENYDKKVYMSATGEKCNISDITVF